MAVHCSLSPPACPPTRSPALHCRYLVGNNRARRPANCSPALAVTVHPPFPPPVHPPPSSKNDQGQQPAVQCPPQAAHSSVSTAVLSQLSGTAARSMRSYNAPSPVFRPSAHRSVRPPVSPHPLFVRIHPRIHSHTRPPAGPTVRLPATAHASPPARPSVLQPGHSSACPHGRLLSRFD